MNESLASVIAGSCGGITIGLVGHPFDLVKSRLANAAGSSQSISGTIKSILKESGPIGFYNGVGAVLAGQVFYRSLVFFSYHHATQFSSSVPVVKDIDACRWALSGGIMGGIVTLIETPMELVKLQAIRLSSNSSFAVGKQLVATHGYRTLYQGFTATLLRNVPGEAFFFCCYEGLTSKSVGFNPLVAGGVCGFCYWTVAYPLDLVKTVMQMHDPAKHQQRLSWRNTIMQLWRGGGVKRFFKGYTPCAVRALPATAIMMMTVDTVKMKLTKDSQHHYDVEEAFP